MFFDEEIFPRERLHFRILRESENIYSIQMKMKKMIRAHRKRNKQNKADLENKIFVSRIRVCIQLFPRQIVMDFRIFSLTFENLYKSNKLQTFPSENLPVFRIFRMQFSTEK